MALFLNTGTKDRYCACIYSPNYWSKELIGNDYLPYNSLAIYIYISTSLGLTVQSACAPAYLFNGFLKPCIICYKTINQTNVGRVSWGHYTYVNSRERASEREREGVLQVKLRGKYIHATNDMYICTKGKTKWITSRLWEYSSRSRVWFFIEWVPCSKWKAMTGVVAPASLEIWIAQSGPSRGLAVGLLLCSKKNWITYKNM